MADNGGATMTMKANAGCPAINTGTYVYNNDADGFYLKDTNSIYRYLTTFGSFTPADPAADKTAKNQRGADRQAGSLKHGKTFRVSCSGRESQAGRGSAEIRFTVIDSLYARQEKFHRDGKACRITKECSQSLMCATSFLKSGYLSVIILQGMTGILCRSV
ncbi:MAG: choice-of-anchor Q domain-containing protein [Vulcanimicrobiota bacterium]